jgi:hypothetical protein
VRNIPRGRHERTKQNPHQLTRRQLQVPAVLEKLQVRSRGEAAAVANRLGLGTPGKPIQATKH